MIAPALCLVAIIAGTYVTVRVLARWVYRDQFDPDQRRYRGDWALWQGEINRKSEAAE